MRLDIDISGSRSKSVEEFDGQLFDYVITVYDSAREAYPMFFGAAQKLHHAFDDPGPPAAPKRIALCSSVASDELRQ